MMSVARHGSTSGASNPQPLSCDVEAIHTPGAIQPHGALVAVDAERLLITHASANLFVFLGLEAGAVLGRPLSEVIGDAACQAFEVFGAQENAATGQLPSVSGPNGMTLNLQAHRSGTRFCIDIQPEHPDADEAATFTGLLSLLEQFKHAGDSGELCDSAVRGIRSATGYDRAMVYRFAKDGHGEVFAEALDPDMEPFLGLHYPAADIPEQGRRLYLRQRIGSISNSSYVPVPLLTRRFLDDGEPLDLTFSALRSVSPMHLKYMRNMGTAASLTVALVVRGALWGMLVCHHRRPMTASLKVRSVVETVGQILSLVLGSLDDAEASLERLKRNHGLTALVDHLGAPIPLIDAFRDRQQELLDLVGAAGALVRFSGQVLLVGHTPPSTAAELALDLLWEQAGSEMLAVDDLCERYPKLACCTAQGSGALLLPISADSGDAILWFRPEIRVTVTWGGNPAEHTIVDVGTGSLSPRASFASWEESVSGRSAPWSEIDLAAASELRSAVAGVLAQRTKAELARLRHYDPLTGLPNRSLLEERLKAAVGSKAGVAILFLDLDRFKAINDTFGHAAGDALLVEVARRLLVAVGAENLAARLGGDEFVVLCQGMTPSAVQEMAERVRKSVEAPFDILGRSCHVSASIGIATADLPGGLDVVRAADIAMYAAKKDGGNRGVVFAPELFDRAANSLELEEDLRKALAASNQFVLLYQPIFRIGRDVRQLAGFEALVRWRHPRRGWLSPNLFIPLAEKSSLIVALGDWVLASAVRQATILKRAYPGLDLLMEVNVSPLQLPHPGFPTRVEELLTAADLPPESLCLEVTEGILPDEMSSGVLASIRKLGVGVAIDDFGSGYSSLSQLRQLPVDVVKLDRSFLKDIEDDASNAEFVTAVIALSHAAGKPVVFEGVETQSQFDIVRAAGADMVQGFYFAPPLSENAAKELVLQQPRASAPSEPRASAP
jgi:diguanylate cyclase (GGDEF)-like protein